LTKRNSYPMSPFIDELERDKLSSEKERTTY
jgi:hypothetical protein